MRWTPRRCSFILDANMSERLPPLAVPLAPLDNDAPSDEDEETRQMVETLDGPASSRSEAAWADEVAEQVAALWEGRPGVTPFEQAVSYAREQPPKRRPR